MKKVYLFALAAATLVGCSSDEYLGENPSLTQGRTDAILFSGVKPSLTRGTSVGEEAATKLGNNFVVYGTKHTTAAEDETADNDALVFNQYDVKYTANSAGTAEDNTHNWAYVDNRAYASITGKQSIKYWDYGAANGYTFYAFSSSDISYPANDASDLVKVTKTTTGTTVYDKGYSLIIKNGANLDNLYFADRVEVAKSAYGDPVVFNFRNVAAKVRVGFYETVPGYSVKIDKFYYDDNATTPVTTYAAMDHTSTSFRANVANVDKSINNTITITYNDDSDASIENQAKLTNSGATYAYDLSLGSEDYSAVDLGTSATNPTWDNTAGAYTTIYAHTANTMPMLVRLDYTLTSTDGSNEKIHVKNARAIVPVQYVQWKNNTTYTYLFKISSNTNGTTGTTPTDPDDPSTTPDPEGLFPITFDAVVVETTDGIQETITTVATNSVTTYAKNSDVTTDGEYKAGANVYFVTEDQSTHTPIVPTGVGTISGKAKVYKITGTNALKATEADVTALLTGLPVTGITLTSTTYDELVSKVPANDGTEYDFTNKVALKSKLSDAGKYAYVYTTTKYVAPTYASASGDTYNPAKTYFFLTTEGVYTAASGLDASNWDTYKASLYKKTANGTPGVYTVKVVTVQ